MDHSSSASSAAGQPVSSSNSSHPYIVVEGFGSVPIVPDYGSVTIEVDVERHDLPDARREANKRMNAVLEALKSLDVPAKDIQTNRFAVDIVRDYNNGRHIFRGYRVSHKLYVRARPPERLGEIIDTAFDAGANEIGGISFYADDPEAAHQEARSRAVNNALAKANQLAQLTGVNVGLPLRIEEPPRETQDESDEMPRYAMMSVADMTPSTTISPGAGPVGVRVRIYFAIA